MTHKLRIYLTHDTEDIELIRTLNDLMNLMGFDVFLSPLDMPGKTQRLDDTSKGKIENCDILIALLTRKTLRFELVKEEIDFARSTSKLVLPLLRMYEKFPKIGKAIGHYQTFHFHRSDIVSIANCILSRIDIAQTNLGISRNSLTEAKRVLQDYSLQPLALKMSKISRRETFRDIVAEAIEKLGYTVRTQLDPFPRTTQDKMHTAASRKLVATREGCRVNVACFFRGIDVQDVDRIAGQMISEIGEIWIVATGFTPAAYNQAHTKGLNLVSIDALLNELASPSKESLWQRYTRLTHMLAASIVDRKYYPELRTLVKATSSAQTSIEKGRTLERLAECFVNLFSGLAVAGKNISLQAEELDLIVKNEIDRIFWQRLGTPIIVECKNWTKPVGAREIRDLVQKMREVRTAFLIAAHGVTSRNGAHYEIIEARKEMKFVLVFDMRDFEEILRGSDPEEIIRERFYSLWTGA